MEEVVRDRGRSPDAGGRSGLPRKLDAAGWGALFIWVGLSWILGWGTGALLLGASVVILGIQIVRRALHLSVEVFSLFVGLCLAVAAVWNLARFRADLVPVLFILAGVVLLTSALMRSRRYA
jgi:hypothetical protein